MLRNELYIPWFVGSQDWGFEIISGDFSNTVVQITKLDVGSEDGNLDEEGNMQIDYHIIKKPSAISDEEFAGKKFQLVFETVVNDVLREALEALEESKDEQNRTNNTTQPDTQ